MITLIYRIGILIYILFQILDLYYWVNTISKETTHMNLENDNNGFLINLNNFDFAIRLEYFYNDTNPEVL